LEFGNWFNDCFPNPLLNGARRISPEINEIIGKHKDRELEKLGKNLRDIL
jgi:hypothetical protein